MAGGQGFWQAWSLLEPRRLGHRPNPGSNAVSGAFQNEMAIRIGTLEASIANLTDIVERLRREQRDTSKDTLGIID